MMVFYSQRKTNILEWTATVQVHGKKYGTIQNRIPVSHPTRKLGTFKTERKRIFTFFIRMSYQIKYISVTYYVLIVESNI